MFVVAFFVFLVGSVSVEATFDYDGHCKGNEEYNKCRSKYSGLQCYDHYKSQCGTNTGGYTTGYTNGYTTGNGGYTGGYVGSYSNGNNGYTTGYTNGYTTGNGGYTGSYTHSYNDGITSYTTGYTNGYTTGSGGYTGSYVGGYTSNAGGTGKVAGVVAGSTGTGGFIGGYASGSDGTGTAGVVGGAVGTGGGIRHLQNTRALADDHGECMAEEYDMFLVMKGAHMTGLATPVNESSSCPNVVFHSNVAIEGGMTKSILTVEQERVSSIAEDEKLHLGSESLFSIVSAFDNADVSKKDEKAYDAVTNNCVVLLRNMADPLNIAIDKRMISFVSKRLLSQSAEHMIDLMKQSPALSTIVGTGDRFLKGVGAEEIVSKVIELYV